MTKLEEKPREAAGSPEPPPRRSAPLRLHVLGAILARNFTGYFSNPAGYVFIAFFVLAGGLAEFWQAEFFANNLANLGPLNVWMPFVLLFFIPAITMSVWADERRQGTEELLLTLPARDVEIVLGKYLAALGIYTVALGFLALGLISLLLLLGSPDLGVFAANILGYWLVGAMLLSFGMVASMLTSNVTVAFILGAVLCSVPVVTKLLGSPTAGSTRRFIEWLSVSEQSREFGNGGVSLAGVLYFVTLAAGMLYLNVILLGRRHWAGGPDAPKRWTHSAVRFGSIVLALISLDVLAHRVLGSWQVDLTEERLHSLSPVTRSILRKIPSDRPVLIQAYISPEVPREYVQTRLDLIDTLQTYAAMAGDRIRLKIFEVDRYSDTARDAEKRFGITPKRVPTSDDARQSSKEIYLGVAFTSGPEEVVVPFFDRGLPVEYELTRSIRVVSGEKRKRVGILATDARLLGGIDFRSMGQDPEWAVVTELKKQYDVTSVAADAPIPGDLAALVVAQPSSLTQRQVGQLTEYVRKGGATLLLMDPFPQFDPSLAPTEPKTPPGGGFGGPPPEPKGDLGPLLDVIGVDWPATEIVWNRYNPHQQLDVPPEIVFVGPGSGARPAFSEDPSTSGLQEVVFLFCGTFRPRPSASTEFTSLLKTNDRGGTMGYEDLVRRGAFGMSGLQRDRPYVEGLTSYTLAARITGTLPPEPAAPPAAGQPRPNPKPSAKANVIAVADLDFIADNFFELRRKTVEAWDAFDFDNVSFILNCVDELSGDDQFIALRKKRARHRTLRRVEEQSEKFVKKAQEESRKAEDDAKSQLEEARKRLEDQVEEIRKSKEYDEKTKETMVEYRREVESRRLAVREAEIEDRKRRQIQESLDRKDEAILQIRNNIRRMALLMPLPAVLLGAMVSLARAGRENRGANPNRLA